LAAGVSQREGVQASAHFTGPAEEEDHRGVGQWSHQRSSYRQFAPPRRGP
jgi:hypothetical protein